MVGLLWRDDLDTAFRHLDLYDRFGCPSAHIQASFRCLILHGNNIDPKAADTLNARVQACWINPAAAGIPAPAAAVAAHRGAPATERVNPDRHVHAASKKMRNKIRCLEFAISGRYVLNRRSSVAFSYPSPSLGDRFGRPSHCPAWLYVMRTVAAVLALVACVHAGLWALLRTEVTAPDFTGSWPAFPTRRSSIPSIPTMATAPTAEQIRADLKTIAPYTRAIRTYSSTGGAELVPPIAAEFGLKVTVGAWIDKNQDRNEREIRSALDLARHNSNVNAIVVGNETMLRNETSADDLIKLIKRVKRSSPVPVTTGEIWNSWLDHPELASAVDFIAAHILPYWEGLDASQAVDQAIEIYDQLRRLYPGKRIVIAEFGWPSAGYNLRDANPGRIEQAVMLRNFVARAEAYGIDYNIVEAIDQPWKTFEGGVGPIGASSTRRGTPKFSWTGPITDPDYSSSPALPCCSACCCRCRSWR